MKIFVCMLALLLCECTAFADTPEIKALDVYPSGAVFTFSLYAGNGTFQAEIPGAFQADTIRILNPQDISDVKIITQPRSEWIPPALSGINSQIKEHERTIKQLTARKSALEQTQALLKSADPPERTDAKDIISYIQMAHDMKLNTENEINAITESLDAEREKSNLLGLELSARMPDNAKSAVLISGRMNSDRPLMFEAFTSSAQWSPLYTMDLDSRTGKITTRLFARSSQSTGLNYDGAITFHTKHPEERVNVPAVNPLKVSIKPKPQPTKTRFDSMAMMAEAPMKARSEAANRAVNMSAPAMTVTLADHAVHGAGSLTGDGRSSEFTLGDIELSGTARLVLIPEQRSSAWIVVDMDSVNVPLIPGTATLRVDGQAAGTTSIPEYGLGQKKIAFGYAPQITAKKEPLIGKKGSSWFSGGTFTGGYTLKITNSMNEAKTVTVQDRLPIPTDDKIKLEVKSIKPEPKERDKENRLTWELELKPKETAEIIVDYSLNYPSGEELQYR